MINSDSNSTQKTVHITNSVYVDCLNYTNQVLQGAEHWRETLKNWHYEERISPKKFEDALIDLCRSEAIDTTGWILENIHKAVTGEEASIKKLRGIINIFCYNDEWD